MNSSLLLIASLGVMGCKVAPSTQVEVSPPPTPMAVQSPTAAPEAAPAVAAATVAALTGPDWPRYRGPASTGVSPDTGLSKDWQAQAPRLVWQVPMSDGGYSGPAVADGKVFLLDHEGQNAVVRALDFETGRELWRHAFPEGGRNNYGFGKTTPVYDRGNVFVFSQLGHALSLNADTGAVVWSRNLASEVGGQKPRWDYSSSPVVDGDRVLFITGGASLVHALDRNTGRNVWASEFSGPGAYASPVVAQLDGRRQVLVFAARNLIGMDPTNGRTLWSVPWETMHDCNAADPIVIGPNEVFITSGYGRGCAVVQVRGGNASFRWQNREMQAHFSSPVFANGYIWGTGDPGFLMCINPADGRVMWRQAGFEKGGIVVVDGVILALGGSNGDLVMARLNPNRFEELGRVRPLGGQSWTAPIVAHGSVIVRNTRAVARVALR